MLVSEKVTLFLLLGILVFASFQIFLVNSAVTEKEAIEISGNTYAVQDFLEQACEYWVNATYLDEEEVRTMKGWDPEHFSKLPYDHGVWEIVWTVRLKPSGISEASLYHFIDEETGEILVELRGIGLA